MSARTRNLRLKNELKNRKISQVAMAFQLELNRSKLNLIVNGWEIPTPELRLKIADYLQVDESEIFDN